MSDRRAKHILLAGTGGGVGTTTTTALLFTALAANGAPAPELLDHTGGELGLRLTAGDEVPAVDPSLTLHDFGPHAFWAARDALGSPDAFVVVTTAATPAGIAAAERFLAEVRSVHGAGGLRRVIVAAVAVFGRHRIGPLVERLHDSYGRRLVVVVPQDLALAAGGRVPQNRLRPDTRRAQGDLASLLRERLSTHR